MGTAKRMLITGFDPFGGAVINPSWEAVQRLPDAIGEYCIEKLEIPTIFGVAANMVLHAAEAMSADVILCVGQAGGRKAVTPERIGINLRDANIADNAGKQPHLEPVVVGGADGYFATVPVERIVKEIVGAGYPASVSNSAGTFVCNDVLYTLLHHFRDSRVMVGFIHVPWLPEQGEPSMVLEDIVRALEAAILAI